MGFAMNLINAIANLHGTGMLDAIMARAIAFELGQILLTGLIVAVWTADRPGPRIWKPSRVSKRLRIPSTIAGSTYRQRDCRLASGRGTDNV